MDISAWERRASAYEGLSPGYADEDEGYFEDSGEMLSPEDYEEMLFQRVLDKIRIARAAGNEDIQLSTEELDAYQSKLHGARTPASRPQPVSRPTDSSLNDTASVASVQIKHAHASSRSKKEKQRTSLFGSKSKKDKEKDKSSHRKRVSTSSSIASHPPSQTSPGFVIPGPDDHPVFTPINAYQGNLSHDQPTSHPKSRSISGTQHHQHQRQPTPLTTPPRDVLGAFPGSEHTYRLPTPAPTSPSQMTPQHPSLPSLSARQQAYARERHLEAQGLVSPSQQVTRGIPFPVEMYQYQAFSPQTQQYSRRFSSAGQSEASWSSMPRRVPVPAPAPVPVPLQRSGAGLGGYDGGEGYGMGGDGDGDGDSDGGGGEMAGMEAEQAQGSELGTTTGMGKNGRSKEGERRRKSGKAKKKS